MWLVSDELALLQITDSVGWSPGLLPCLLQKNSLLINFVRNIKDILWWVESGAADFPPYTLTGLTCFTNSFLLVLPGRRDRQSHVCGSQEFSMFLYEENEVELPRQEAGSKLFLRNVLDIIRVHRPEVFLFAWDEGRIEKGKGPKKTTYSTGAKRTKARTASPSGDWTPLIHALPPRPLILLSIIEVHFWFTSSHSSIRSESARGIRLSSFLFASIPIHRKIR